MVEKNKYNERFGKEKKLIKSVISYFQHRREGSRRSRSDDDLMRDGDRDRSKRRRGCSGERYSDRRENEN